MRKSRYYFCIISVILCKVLFMHATPEKQGTLFVAYGPSGAGKTTLVTAVVAKLTEQYPLAHVVTYTCRPPRTHEIDHRDYHFISPDEFNKKNNDGFFLDTNLYADNLYGCPNTITQELAQGKNLIVILDRNGAHKMLESINNSVLIWISASIDDLRSRLHLRKSETEQQIEKRLAQATIELAQEEKNKMHHYKIVNKNLSEAVNELTAIVIHNVEVKKESSIND